MYVFMYVYMYVTLQECNKFPVATFFLCCSSAGGACATHFLVWPNLLVPSWLVLWCSG